MTAKVIPALILSFAATAFAQKPCEELKTEIAAKLDAKGVKNYTLDIVATDDIKDQKVVGSCDGGSKKITYAREAPATTSVPAASDKKASTKK